MGRVALILCVVVASGCSAYLEAIPAHRVPPAVREPKWEEMVRVNLATLQLPHGAPYTLQPGDVVAVSAENLFPNDYWQLPVPTTLPNRGRPQLRPSTGYPFVVNALGELRLPGIEPVNVVGATIPEAEQRVRNGFTGKLRPLDITLALTLPRTKSVLVVREDSVFAGSASQVASADVEGTRYRGQVFDLHLEPGESDVLTAMVKSGGLPGLDAKNELIILRRRFENDEQKVELLTKLENSENAAETLAKDGLITEVIRLRVPAGTTARQHNIALRPGDVVMIEHQPNQVFYTGGAFLTGQFPLARDQPVDVLQAVAIAGGTQSGLDYGAGGLQGIASVGDATSLVPPTWVILVRKYGDRQVAFKIDLLRATWDRSQRMIVQPGDYLHLAYRPRQIAGNVALKNFGSRAGFALSKVL